MITDFDVYADVLALTGIDATGTLYEAFELGDMSKLMTLLDECVADLETHWGGVITSNGRQGPARLPTRGPGKILDSRHCPKIALSLGQSGTVDLILLVDETGRVADCTLMESSGVAALDAQSCNVYRELGQFTPAIGADGKPSRGIFRQRITWRVQ